MINDRVRALRTVLSRNPAYSMLTVNDDGTIVNKLSGETYSNLNAATDEIYASNISEFRRVGPTATRLERRTGASALESEVTAINRFIGRSSSAQLERLGLGRLAGKQIDGTFLLYNWKGKPQVLESILNPSSVYRTRFPGFTNITDEGVQVFSYGIAGDDVPLSALEQSMLKTAAGVQTFRAGFVEKFLKAVATGDNEKVGTYLSKLPKRVASQLSPRTVSFEADEISEAISKMPAGAKVERVYDPSDLILRIAGGEKLEGLDALLMSKTGGRMRGSLLLGQEEALEIIARTSGIMGGTPTDSVENPFNLNTLLKRELELARRDIGSSGGNMLDALKARVGSIAYESDEQRKYYTELIERMGDNLETFRDGSYWLTDSGYKKLLAGKRTEYNNLRSSLSARGNITAEEVEELKLLKDQIDKIQGQIDNHGRVQDPMRIGSQSGTFKGDAGVLSFEDLISEAEVKKLKRTRTKLQNKKVKSKADQREIERIDEFFEKIYNPAKADFKRSLIIAPESALKKEMGSEVASYIAGNIAKKHSSEVFLEPFQLMIDPTAYTDPSFLAKQQQLLARVKSGMDEFRRTGAVPDELISQLKSEARAFGVDPSDTRTYGKVLDNIPVELLDPKARALAMVRRRQIEEIFNALMSNRDARSIPEIVSRVNNYYTTQVYTEKLGEPRLLSPDAQRYRIRTYGSEQASVFGVRYRGGKDFIPVDLAELGGKKDATFVQFSLKGDAMMVSDENAALYKASLGTFDLDDKGIPMMRTFKDAEGKTRVAFITYRDPKSYEEFIYARANLHDKETLHKILNNDPDIIRSLQGSFDESGFKAALMEQTGLDEDVLKKVYDRVQQIGLAKNPDAVKGRATVGLRSVDQLFAVETIMRLAKEKQSGPLQSLTETPSMRAAFIEAVSRGAASTRSRDALTTVGGVRMTVQMAQNLGAEKGAKYFNKAFVELNQKASAEASTGDRFVQLVNETLGGGRNLTAQQIEGIYSGERLVTGVNRDKLVASVNYALEDLLQISSKEGIPSIENTIGVLANRMSSVFSVAAQMEEGLPTDAISFLAKKYAVGIIPASDMVDLVKQLIGNKELLSFDDASRGLDDYEKEKLENVYKSIARRVEKRTGAIEGSIDYRSLTKFELDDVAKAAMDQQFERMGYQRALQIAQGTAEESLIGLDPMIAAKRLVAEEGQEIAATAIRRGMTQALNTSEEAGIALTSAQKDTLRAAIAAGEGLTASNFIESVALKEGTDAYNKYAAMSIQSRLANQYKAEIGILEKNAARLATNRITAKADLRTAAEAMLRSSGLTDLFESLERTQSMVSAPTPEESVIKNMISSRLAQGIKAIRDNYPGGAATDVLDIVDATELELTNKFGARAAKYLGGLGDQGEEDVMMSLFQLARTRRRANADTMHVGSFNFIQDLFREHMRDDTLSLAEVDQDYAKEFLKFQRELPAGSEDATKADQLTEYMQRVAGEEVKFSGTEANNAFTYSQSQKALEGLKGDTDSVASLITPVSESDELSAMSDEILRSFDIDDEPFEVARSPYRRIGQSFREGQLGELFKSKSIRTAAVAAGALVVGSFVYQARKDRTAGDIKGPPLLPGGNPYETNYPSIQPNINNYQQGGIGSSGVQYRINTSGSMEDLNRLRGLFGDVVDGPIDSTMYNGLPRLGQDPYADVASRF